MDSPRRCCVMGAILLAALTALGPVARVGLAQTGHSEATVISSGRLRVTIHTVTEEDRLRVILKSIESVADGFAVDLSASPIFQVTLERAGRQEALQEPIQFPAADGPPDAAHDRVSVDRISDKTVEIRFDKIPVPDTPQRLSVTIRLDVGRPDGAVEWSGSAVLSGEGDLVITALQLPYLRVGTLGGRGDDDTVAYPLTGGLLLEDPIRTGGQLRLREANPLFLYPGYVESQFMAYYDAHDGEDGTKGGLYLAAEDPDGYVKSLYFKPAANARALDLYIRHFNYAPDPYVASDKAKSGLGAISLPQKLPYGVVLDLFEGDWIDAADRYRDWLERTRPVFLKRGKVFARQDEHPADRQPMIGLAYVLAGGATPLAPDGPDLSTLEQTTAFFSDREGAPMPSAVTFVGDITANTSEPSIGNDMGVYAMREGLADFVWQVRGAPWSRSITALGLNRDIGNWVSSRARNREEVLRGGLVTRIDGSPHVLGPSSSVIKSVTCGGSALIREQRLGQFEGSWMRFERDGRIVIDNTALSGRGSQSWLCYGPLSDRGHLEEHHHTIGGGNYCAVAYRDLVETLRKRFAPYGMRIMPEGERAHEQMIDSSHLGGRARAEPWDVTFHGTSLWIQGGVPVPMRSYLYHEWVMLSARMPRRSNVFPVYVDAYRAAGQDVGLDDLAGDESFLTLDRQRMARWTADGLRLGFYIQGPGPELEERRKLDGPPGTLPPGLEQSADFLREMVRLRSRAKRFLVYGKMLRPPSVDRGCTSSRLSVVGRQGLKHVTMPSICTSAWRAPTGEVGLVLVNYAALGARIRLRLDPADWGLTSDAPIVLEEQVEGDGPSNRYRLAVAAEGRLLSPWITVPRERPTKVFIVRNVALP